MCFNFRATIFDIRLAGWLFEFFRFCFVDPPNILRLELWFFICMFFFFHIFDFLYEDFNAKIFFCQLCLSDLRQHSIFTKIFNFLVHFKQMFLSYGKVSLTLVSFFSFFLHWFIFKCAQSREMGLLVKVNQNMRFLYANIKYAKRVNQLKKKQTIQSRSKKL